MTTRLLALLAVLIGLVAAPARGAGTVRSPHGQPDGCPACHAPTAGDDRLVGAPLPVVATCRGCHPTADMHPVGMTPDKVHVPADFPLEAGKVTCATCHAEPSHAGVNLPVPWHRGGPYPRSTELCYRCHEREGFVRSNPHGDGRDPTSSTCSACHMGLPAAGAAPPVARLRLGPKDACTNCHAVDLHSGAKEHVGAIVGADVRARLSAAIPLEENGAIACWTCHEVHGDGPAAHPSAGGLGASLRARATRSDWSTLPADVVWPDGADPLLGLPAADDQLCRACHGDAP